MGTFTIVPAVQVTANSYVFVGEFSSFQFADHVVPDGVRQKASIGFHSDRADSSFTDGFTQPVCILESYRYGRNLRQRIVITGRTCMRVIVCTMRHAAYHYGHCTILGRPAGSLPTVYRCFAV